MKTLAELEENIYQCSKCGLCQKACPIYKATGNECTLSRGKFILLNGVIQKHIKLSDKVLEYVDLCLHCNACKNFCPSNIDAREILTAVKSEQYENNKYSLYNLLTSYTLFKSCLFCASIAFNTYRFLRIDKIISKLQNQIIKLGKLGRLILLGNTLATQNVHRKKNKTKTKKALKVVYFQGCVNKYINPSTKNAVLNILDELDCDVTCADFECCGISYSSKGMIDRIAKLAETNLKQLPDEYDYFITDCASCSYMLSKYTEFADESLKDKAKIMSEKSINILDFLKVMNYKKALKSTSSVTFHKPCHYDGDINDILKNIENLKYTEMTEYDSCCGVAGDFAVRHHNISTAISTVKAKNILNTESDIVLTACPACVAGLKQGLLELGVADKPVMNLVELINID